MLFQTVSYLCETIKENVLRNYIKNGQWSDWYSLVTNIIQNIVFVSRTMTEFSFWADCPFKLHKNTCVSFHEQNIKLNDIFKEI